MEADILRREGELLSVSATTRCMSCGQLPPDHPTVVAKRSRGGASRGVLRPHTTAAGSRSLAADPLTGDFGSPDALSVTMTMPQGGRNVAPNVVLDDEEEVSLASAGEMLQMNGAEGGPDGLADGSMGSWGQHGPDFLPPPLSAGSGGKGSPGHALPVRSEDVYSLVTGNQGLKPLLKQHKAMLPVRDPYAKSRAAVAAENSNVSAALSNYRNPTTNIVAPANLEAQLQRRRPADAERIPEPLYRKARLAAHMKEMVKVSPESALNYGFTADNPFYVMDGMLDDKDRRDLSASGGESIKRAFALNYCVETTILSSLMFVHLFFVCL